MCRFRENSPPGHGGNGKAIARTSPFRGLETLVLAIMAAALVICTAATSFGQGIATDKLNYHPGDSVTIIGQGWKAMEPVTLTIADTSGTREPVVINVSAGATGGFRDSSFVMQESDRGKMLIATARGGASGVETMIAFKDSGTHGALTCSSLTLRDGNHYGVAPGQTVTCSIEGATDLSAGQMAGEVPIEVMVKSSVLGIKPAKVISVVHDTIVFEYSAPANASGSSLVSYGPISACASKSDRCVTFPAEGNNAGVSGGTGAAGFSFSTAPEPAAMAALTGIYATPPPARDSSRWIRSRKTAPSLPARSWFFRSWSATRQQSAQPRRLTSG